MHGGRGLELRRFHLLISGAALLVACGGPARSTRSDGAGGAPAESAVPTAAPTMLQDEAAGMARQVAPAIRGVTDPTRIEPQVLVPIQITPRPSGPIRIELARLDLPPGGAWRPPIHACQDVLMLVREGELRAVGSGIAPPAAPSTLYAGDAVRFGPEGDGLLQNLTDRHARTVVAFVRAEGETSCESPGQSDPLVSATRMSSVQTTPSLEALGGALQVRILLDAEGAGARHGGLSVLDGAPDLVVPEHRHAEAAEVLYVERGQGVMHIGERALRVRAGAALYVPAGVLHSYRGEGGQPLRMIQVYTPSGPEQRYRDRP